MTFDSAINVATLIAIMGFGWRLMRHVHLMEFRVDQMWRWFVNRTDHLEARRMQRYDRRKDDDDAGS